MINGFVLQVEGGRVDHAGHLNDPAAILREQLEFDPCIPLALEFAHQQEDTLLIVTTDHGTGGCQLNGSGHNYLGTGPALERINGFTASFEALAARYVRLGKFDADHFHAAPGLTASPEQVGLLNERLHAEDGSFERFLVRTFAESLATTTSIGWTSHNHTGEWVEPLALGPGSAEIRAFMPNHQLCGVMTQALGVRG